MTTPPSEFIRGFLYLLVYTIRYKINLFSRKHKRKSPKNCIKEKYFLFLQQNKKKKDGKGNISLSVISHKSCNNS